MIWRSILCLLIWLAVITLLLFPDLCTQKKLCERSPTPLLVILGALGIAMAISDGRLLGRLVQALRRRRPRRARPDGQ
ncbi:hypothetical protein [Aquincola tertiaricarbonis]|uniref:hypothetical protein n=1 Tax=Aquincola tertiaricarbonis TaxID=391953 RepID=UPI0012EE6569|nr:hypothetical protein [Aquincola tertiaricarbonis]